MSYILIHPTQHSSGLCAFIWQTIRGIYHNPNEKYYIKFGHECCYYDPTIGNNVWDYYFEQPHVQTEPTDIKKEVGILHDVESEFRDAYLENPTPELIYHRRKQFNSIIKNYIKLLPHMQSKVDTFINQNFVGKKVLGIHLRGTDHPGKKSMQLYFDHIDKIHDEYDLIFACSDEKYRIDALKCEYGSKVVTYDAIRSDGETPLHWGWGNNSIRYKIGEDVIIEAHLLSKSDFLMCCPGSNVNYFARSINPELKYTEIL